MGEHWHVRPIGERWEIVDGASAFCVTFGGENEALAVADALNRHAAEIARLRASIEAQRETIGQLEDASVQWMTEAKQSRAELARLKAELAEIKLRAWGHDQPTPDVITHAECKIDGERTVALYRGDVSEVKIGGAPATLTRFVRADEVDRLKADAAKDAEMIAELAGDLEDAEVASWRNEAKGRASIERRGLCKVEGRWRRVK